jgi:hypothetical protein
MYRTTLASDVFDAIFVAIAGSDYRQMIPPDILDQAFEALPIWFHSEYQATLGWRITADDIRGFTMPIQNVYGADTAPYFREVCLVMKRLNARVKNTEISGGLATHFIPFTHAKPTARAIAEFSVERVFERR